MKPITLVLCLAATCWELLACAETAPTAEMQRGNNFTNRDGSVISVSLSSRLQVYEVKLTSSTGKSQVIQALPLEFENADMHSAIASDLNGDGYGDIDLEGDCGNRACSHATYLFDPTTKTLHKALAAEFSTAVRHDGFLLLGSGSGCCAYEYRALRLSLNGMRIESHPEFYVGVQSPDSPSGKSRCSFLNSDRRPIAALQAFLDLCKVYGPAFETVPLGDAK